MAMPLCRQRLELGCARDHRVCGPRQRDDLRLGEARGTGRFDAGA